MPKDYRSGEGAAIDRIIEELRLVNGDLVKLDAVCIYVCLGNTTACS